jgi:hypothetical protein
MGPIVLGLPRYSACVSLAGPRVCSLFWAGLPGVFGELAGSALHVIFTRRRISCSPGLYQPTPSGENQRAGKVRVGALP